MNIAILGGTRFIGFHLASSLVGTGHHEITLLNRGQTVPPAPLPPQIRSVAADRNDPNHASLLLQRSFDVVVDLSGHSPSQILPFLTASLMERIGHYIFCSTSSVYRTPSPVPHSEDAARSTTAGTYGGDKALAEDLLLRTHAVEGWPVTILRPQGVFGPIDGAQAALIFSRLWHRAPMFCRGDQNARLNLLYVADLTKLVQKLAGNASSYGKIYNVAGHEAVTLRQLVDACVKVADIEPDLHSTPDWRHRLAQDNSLPWPPHDLVADNSAVVADVGDFFTPLAAGLSATWQWLQEHPERLTPQCDSAEALVIQHQPIPLSVLTSRLRQRVSSKARTALWRRA